MKRFDRRPMDRFVRVIPSKISPCVFLDDKPPLEEMMTRAEALYLYEIWIDPLEHRYKDPCFIHTEYGAVRVKADPVIPDKDQVLLRKLVVLVEHPSSNPHERENAKKRIEEIGVRLEEEMDLEFLNIDRKELYLDNFEILCEGRCGLLQGDMHEALFVYARTSEEADEWMNVAQFSADNYVKIPRRLTA